MAKIHTVCLHGFSIMANFYYIFNEECTYQVIMYTEITIFQQQKKKNLKREE